MIKLFDSILPVLVKKSIAGKLPLFISQNWLYQKMWKTALDQHYEATQKIYRFVFENVVKHRATLDPSNPRDYLGTLLFVKYSYSSSDMLLIEADSESRIGWDSIGGTAQIRDRKPSEKFSGTGTARHTSNCVATARHKISERICLAQHRNIK